MNHRNAHTATTLIVRVGFLPLPRPPRPSHHGNVAQLRPLSSFAATSVPGMAMRPGTPIPGLDKIYPIPKDGVSKAPVSLPREEYPPWVNELTQPLPSLAKLRTMRVEDASDRDMKRYLKLVRKTKIKSENESLAKS